MHRLMPSSDATTGNVVAGKKFDVVQSKDVRGVSRREYQSRTSTVNRYHVVLLDNFLRNQLGHLGINLNLVKIHRRNAVLFGHEVSQFALVEKAELSNLRAKTLTLHGRLITSFRKLVSGEQILLDQQLADSLVQESLPFPLMLACDAGLFEPGHLLADSRFSLPKHPGLRWTPRGN